MGCDSLVLHWSLLELTWSLILRAWSVRSPAVVSSLGLTPRSITPRSRDPQAAPVTLKKDPPVCLLLLRLLCGRGPRGGGRAFSSHSPRPFGGVCRGGCRGPTPLLPAAALRRRSAPLVNLSVPRSLRRRQVKTETLRGCHVSSARLCVCLTEAATPARTQSTSRCVTS